MSRRFAAPLWQPTSREREHSNLARFARANGFPASDYAALHRWSTACLEDFWCAVWDFSGVIGERGETALIRSAEGAMTGAHWFPQARLNFAENLLCGADTRLAIVETDESGHRRDVSMGELRGLVSRAQQGLRRLGVRAGDTVGGILPNNADALVALLATASLGAVWASCSPDFGAPGIIDRIGQVNPKVLLTVGSYVYNGKRFPLENNIAMVLNGLQDLKSLVVIGECPALPELPSMRRLTWDELCGSAPAALVFERFPFEQPLYVMFTSGTTGLPKGIVHGAGGTLLQHRKEHLLHCDVHPGDVMSWYTNTAWMMYHWVVSGLASHATVVLYEGAAVVKREGGNDLGVLWHMAEQAGVTHFGTSPRYLATLAEQGFEPGRNFELGALRSVLSAGAPVQPEQFDWIYRAIKRDIIFASISGGTEIMGCFVLGSPLHPVRRGEITCKALGMAVDVLDDRGASIIGRNGELVCTEPFPSAPLTFWGEDGDARYHAAYFEARPGIWTHGDLAEQTIEDTVVIYGRSDTTLKPGGVRIGTAEIYRVVEAQAEVEDSVVFGYPVEGDEEIVLCVVMKDGHVMSESLVQRIRAEIRAKASPRHVPRHVFRVDAVPYTINGKRVEGAVKAAAVGQPVKNLGSIANPQSLSQYATLMRQG